MSPLRLFAIAAQHIIFPDFSAVLLGLNKCKFFSLIEMEKDSVRECLLADEDSLSRQLETLYRSKPSRNLLSRYRGMLAMFGVLLLSLALNIFQSLRGRKLANMPDTGRSYYSIKEFLRYPLLDS